MFFSSFFCKFSSLNFYKLFSILLSANKKICEIYRKLKFVYDELLEFSFSSVSLSRIKYKYIIYIYRKRNGNFSSEIKKNIEYSSLLKKLKTIFAVISFLFSSYFF